MKRKKFPPIHPGRMLLQEFLEPLNLSQYRLAKDIGVSPPRINEIVQGKRAITADTSLRLARYFRLSEGFWLALQNQYDLDVAKAKLADRLDTKVRVCSKVPA